MYNLHLIGIDGSGPGSAAQALINRAACLFSSARFRPWLAEVQGEILPISPLAEAIALMAARLAGGDIVVLASGDPLFFGIGRTLIQRFGVDNVLVSPALSSMQLAFARCKEPWEDAAFLSLHGRGEVDIMPTLLERKKVFLLTDGRHQPQAIAAGIVRGLESLGLPDSECRIMVGENLGLNDERLTQGSPSSIASQRFAELNVMIIRLEATTTIPAQDFRLGLREGEITHSRGLISKDEVRAVILHRLRLPQGGVLWDVGAGSASVSIEAARLCPGLSVYAIERHPDEQANIKANRRALRLANLHLVDGPAPDALHGLPAPDRVFIGGSGGQLPTIIEAVSKTLQTNGLVLVSAVTAATREAAPRLLHQHGFQVEISTIAVSRETYPPQAGGPLTLNPITLITGST